MTETLSEYRGHDRLKNRTSNIVLSAWGYEVELYEGDELVETRKVHDKSLSYACLLYTSPSPRDLSTSRMPSSA